MAWLFLKIHTAVVWVVVRVARLVGRALWSFIVAVLALLGEEFRRWAGLAVWCVLLVAFGKLALAMPDGVRRPLLLTDLLLLGIWALAVRRAARITRHNNLVKVRQRRAFKELADDVKGVRGGLIEGMARRTQDHPVGRVFGSNRRRSARQEQQRQAKTERDAAAAVEAVRLADEDELRRDDLAALEPDPY